MGRNRASCTLIAMALLAGCARTEKSADTLASTGAVPDSVTKSTASTTTTSTTTTSQSSSIRTASAPTLGVYLTDANGRSLYMFVKDQKNVSTCTDACAQAWPPFGPSASPSPDTLVKAAMLGTITRSDSRGQATYNGMPVYYYEDDKQAGDTKGQGKNEFGGLWYLVSPGGQRIEKKR